jgi:hypothetical protein
LCLRRSISDANGRPDIHRSSARSQLLADRLKDVLSR